MASGPLSARVRQMRYVFGLVRYDEAQGLTSTERAQARTNIGAADAATAALAARNVNAGTALTGGGNLTQDRTISADIATQAAAQEGTANDKLMTPLRTAQAIAAQTVGRNQTWRNMDGQRTTGVVYGNPTDNPIMAVVTMDGSASNRATFEVRANPTAPWVRVAYGSPEVDTMSAIVPPGHQYRVQGGDNLLNWAELR